MAEREIAYSREGGTYAVICPVCGTTERVYNLCCGACWDREDVGLVAVSHTDSVIIRDALYDLGVRLRAEGRMPPLATWPYQDRQPAVLGTILPSGEFVHSSPIVLQPGESGGGFTNATRYPVTVETKPSSKCGADSPCDREPDVITLTRHELARLLFAQLPEVVAEVARVGERPERVIEVAWERTMPEAREKSEAMAKAVFEGAKLGQ